MIAYAVNVTLLVFWLINCPHLIVKCYPVHQLASRMLIVWCTTYQVENVISELSKSFPDDGLLPIYIDPKEGKASHATITFGAMGDRYSIIQD